MPRPARRLLVAIALALTLGAAGSMSVPAIALASAADIPVAVAPAEGEFVVGSVVLEWTSVDAPEGYEVTWATDEGEDAGSASTTDTSTTIEVAGGSYAWQVRALPDGEWSLPATFHVDLELDTLPMPADPMPAEPTAAAPRPVLETIPGGVWIGGALGFAAVFLVVVVVQSRLHREQDA